MSRTGWYVGGAASFGTAVLFSQLRFNEERQFPIELGELADQEHGHEVASDATEEFFEGRNLMGRLTWLFYILGVICTFRGLLTRPN